MGLLKEGKKCTIMQGRNFGKTIVIDSVDSKFVYYKSNGKNEKIGIMHVFPLE